MSLEKNEVIDDLNSILARLESMRDCSCILQRREQIEGVICTISEIRDGLGFVANFSITGRSELKPKNIICRFCGK